MAEDEYDNSGHAHRHRQRAVRCRRNRTPFGKRWRQEVMTLTAEHLAALQAGKMVAVDVQSEYILFLRLQAGSADE